MNQPVTPIPKILQVSGVFRVHYNRAGAAPMVWSIGTEHWEIAVARFTISAPMRSVFVQKQTPDDDDGKPSAWLEVIGVLTIVDDDVHIGPGIA